MSGSRGDLLIVSSPSGAGKTSLIRKLLEDRTLARAESLPNNAPAVPPNDRQTIYLQGQSGVVHLFRQRVSIPNVDRSAYQP